MDSSQLHNGDKVKFYDREAVDQEDPCYEATVLYSPMPHLVTISVAEINAGLPFTVSEDDLTPIDERLFKFTKSYAVLSFRDEELFVSATDIQMAREKVRELAHSGDTKDFCGEKVADPALLNGAITLIVRDADGKPVTSNVFYTLENIPELFNYLKEQK